MSDISQEVIVANLIEEPETDMYEISFDKKMENASFESSAIDITDSVGTREFMYMWNVLNEYIKGTTIKNQIIFSEQMLNKISDIYDFTFSETVSVNTPNQLNDFYDFIEFIEFKNVDFIINVWRFLKVKSLIHLNINQFCKKNDDKIIKEIDEQLEIHHQSKLVTLFLKSYYKEKMIEWFIKNSESNFIQISVELEMS